MNITSKGYSLRPYPKPLQYVEFKDEKSGSKNKYPVPINAKEIFIRGQGHLKIGKKKKYDLNLLQDTDINAEKLQEIYLEHGIHIVYGLLTTNGYENIFNNSSYYIHWYKLEINNMVKFGQLYDKFNKYVTETGNEFLELLQKNTKLTFTNNEDKITIYDDKKYLFGDLILHPVSHIEHDRMSFRIEPMFNVINFSNVLDHFMRIIQRRNLFTKIDIDNSSTKDKITYLTNGEISSKIENIIKLQESFK